MATEANAPPSGSSGQATPSPAGGNEAPGSTSPTAPATTPPTAPSTLLGTTPTAGTSPAAPPAGGPPAGAEPPKTTETVPEAYQDFKLPEGFELAGPAKEKLVSVARELKLSQEGAQKALDYVAGHIKELREREAAKAAEEAEVAAKAYLEQAIKTLQADPEIGGLRFQSSLDKATGILHRLGSSELVQELQVTGMINSPHLVRMLVKVAALASEDRAVAAGSSGAGGGERDMSLEAIAARSYPGLRKEG